MNAALKVSSSSSSTVAEAEQQRSAQTRRPVRVIRGFKLDSPYAPAQGYRYDGLYTVKMAWMARRLTKGLLVCRYALKRVANQPPVPVRLRLAGFNSILFEQWPRTDRVLEGTRDRCWPTFVDLGVSKNDP